MKQASIESIVIEERNRAWDKNPYIPSWVDKSTVGLDQFFTKPEVAKACYEDLLNFMKKDNADLKQYKFIEPAAGAGAFYDLLPEDRRIGVDIMPMVPEIIDSDFLTWNPEESQQRYATIGNPPFGYRAWLALAFMNHAAKFSDYVGMILPMGFQSEGKGSPKHRVRGLELFKSEGLPQDSFTNAYNSQVKINGLWQVWKRGVNNRLPLKTCSTWLDLFTVDQRKERLCGQKRMDEADFFLQRTFYSDPPQLVKSFSCVKYVCGYGIILKKAKREMEQVLKGVDWKIYSNLAAHNCRHISMEHIRCAVTDAGYFDD